MTRGTWFAYGSPERLMPLDELARRLRPDAELAVRLDQPNLLIVTVHDTLTGNDAEVTISVDTGAHVALEASELAADLASGRRTVDPGVPPPKREALAVARARYELTWDLRFSDETYNTMMMIAELLVKECDATVYDVTNSRFV